MREKTWTSEFAIEVGMRLIRPERAGPARSLAVLLHGMGQDGSLLASKLSDALGGSRHLLIPDGPLPFERSDGEQRLIGHAWYLYTGDQEAFLASAGRTAAWLEREIDAVVAAEGLEAGRVHLVGYSQGGYLAGIMLLDRPRRYASLVSICSRLKHEVWPDRADPAGLPPIAVLHGEKDRFLPIERARESAEALAAMGARIDFRAFPSGHGLSPEQAAATAEILDRIDAAF